MTPAERARQIDREEFAAECAAIRKRALAYAKRCRKAEQQKFKAWLGGSQPAITGLTPIRIAREPVKHTVNGQTRTFEGWAEHLGISKEALIARRRKLGSLEAAIAKGAGDQRGKVAAPVEVNGEARTMQEWAAYLGITYIALAQRIHKRGSLAAAVAMGGPQRGGTKPGVVSNSPAFDETGGKGSAEERANIDFQGNEACPQ